MSTTNALKARIESESAKLPRFIFRYWHPYSGGYPGLNTTRAVTPGAYSAHNSSQHPSSNFYDLDQDYVRRIANMHLDGRSNEHTIFSSWSQTLAAVLGMAGVPDSHISILDTTLLHESNVVLHTVQMQRLGLCTYSYNYELLAFGVISGPSYQAVPISDFNRLTTPVYQDLMSREEIDGIRLAVFALFRPSFRLAVAAHCLFMVDGDYSEKRAHLLSIVNGFEPEDARMLIPAEWTNDTKVMNLEKSYLRSFERDGAALKAAILIRDLILQQGVQGPPPPESVQPASRSMQRPRRWSRELNSLKIGMNNWGLK